MLNFQAKSQLVIIIRCEYLMRKMKNKLSASQYIDGILSNDKLMLSRAITLLESNLPEDQRIAREVIRRTIFKCGNAVRVGITGVPGVGKSTFIESFGIYLTSLGKKVAVLAIDPSSERSRGSIMGDKTRMQKLSQHPMAYIRPSATGGAVGGVAWKTRESMLLCEAAGFEVIIVETVGIGQSEVMVKHMVDFFLLLALMGAGDELQGIKKGVIEMAHAIIITKSDIYNFDQVKKNQNVYKNSLQFLIPDIPYWEPRVGACSAIENNGIEQIWHMIESFYDVVGKNGGLENVRKKQHLHWMHESIKHLLLTDFYHQPVIKKMLPSVEKQLLNQELLPYLAAEELFKAYLKIMNNSAQYADN